MGAVTLDPQIILEGKPVYVRVLSTSALEPVEVPNV